MKALTYLAMHLAIESGEVNAGQGVDLGNGRHNQSASKDGQAESEGHGSTHLNSVHDCPTRSHGADCDS